MSVEEIARALVVSEPLNTLLIALERHRYGRKILNTLSQPRGVFDTFEEGWLAARRTGLAHHEHPSEMERHLEQAKSLRISDYAVLYWLSRISSTHLRIFDFGGNVGNLFYGYLPYLHGSREVDWTVFDLPVVVAEGKRIATDRGVVGLRFTSSVSDISKEHVLLVSGAFHYWEGSVETFLQQLGKLPDHVILNRLPVHETERSFITVQRNRFCAFPCIVRNALEVISAFSKVGYVMVGRWPAPELSLRPPLFPRRWVHNYSGFYFHRR